jgi:hypothetical protein
MSKPAMSALTVGLLSATIVAALAAVAVAAKGKPVPPPPPPLTMDISGVDPFTAQPYAIQGDGLNGDGEYAGYTVNGVAEGAYINSAGGLDLALTTGERAVKLTLGNSVESGGGAPSFCVPNGTWTVHQLSRFGFNVTRSNGVTIGVQALGTNGVPSTVSSGGATAGYNMASIVNFLPDGADSRIEVLTLRFAFAPGTTISRTAADAWSLEHDATDPILLQCTAKSNRGKSITYDVGYYLVPFSLTATCTLGPTGMCQ